MSSQLKTRSEAKPRAFLLVSEGQGEAAAVRRTVSPSATGSPRPLADGVKRALIARPFAPTRSDPARRYALVSRNIHLICGKYRVLITRRPKNVYGGRFKTLSEAIKIRNSLEAKTPAHKPWEIAPRKIRHTIYMLRAERRVMGLCQSCGQEPPKPGCVTCQGCLDFSSTKRRLKRQEARNAVTALTRSGERAVGANDGGKQT